MTVALSGQNIIVSGTGSVHTWADLVALGSTNMVQHTQTNGNTFFRWLNGTITVTDTATLNISNVEIDFLRNTSSSYGLKASSSGIINISNCKITLTGHILAQSNAAIFDSTASNSRINLVDCGVFYRLSPSPTSSSNERISSKVDTVERCILVTQSAPRGAGWEGYNLVVKRTIKDATLAGVALSPDTLSGFTTENLILANSPTVFINWGVNNLDVRDLRVIGTPTHDYYSNTITFTNFIDSTINLANGRVMKNGATLAQGEHKKLASHNLRLIDASGNVQGALIKYTGRTNTSDTTGSDGKIPELLLIFQETNLVSAGTVAAPDFSVYDKPLPTVDYSAYTREIRSYRHLANTIALTVGDKVGSTTTPVDLALVVDTGVTESNTTTVGAYSGISHSTSAFTLSGSLTLSQVYDSRKLYWRNNDGVTSPVADGFTAQFAANITINAPANNPAATARFNEASTTGTLTLGATGDYSDRPWAVVATGVVTVQPGSTDLTGWTFASGATINRASSGTATVTVDASQIANITAGTDVTLQSPQAALRLFGIPDVTNAILYVKNLTTNAVSYPTLSGGEATISVNPDDDYEVRADAPGYLASPFVTLSGATPEYQFVLEDYRTLYESGTNRSSQIDFNYSTLEVTINDDLASYTFADVFRTLEDYLSTEDGIMFPNPPFPVVLPDRNVLWFPYDYGTSAVNPVKIMPDPTNTSDPALSDFEVYLEGATDPVFDLFDFTSAGGRILRVRSSVAVATGSGGGGGLDAAGVRAAIGLASANLDTQLSGINSNINEIPTTPLLAGDYTAPDNAGITTLLSRLTATRAGYLDAAISSRLASDDYTAPDNAGITTIQSVLVAIQGTGFNTNTDSLAALRDRGDSAWVTATGFSTFNPASDQVIVGTNNDKSGYSLTQAFPTNFASLGINSSGHLLRVIDLTNQTSGGLDASGIRAAIGLTTNNLDTQLAGINTNIDDVASDVTDALQSRFDSIDSAIGDITIDLSPVTSAIAQIPANVWGYTGTVAPALVAQVKADVSALSLQTTLNAGISSLAGSLSVLGTAIASLPDQTLTDVQNTRLLELWQAIGADAGFPMRVYYNPSDAEKRPTQHTFGNVTLNFSYPTVGEIVVQRET